MTVHLQLHLQLHAPHAHHVTGKLKVEKFPIPQMHHPKPQMHLKLQMYLKLQVYQKLQMHHLKSQMHLKLQVYKKLQVYLKTDHFKVVWRHIILELEMTLKDVRLYKRLTIIIDMVLVKVLMVVQACYILNPVNIGRLLQMQKIIVVKLYEFFIIIII